MKNKTFLLVGLITFYLFCIGTAAAQTTSVAGEWDASMNSPAGSVAIKLTFTVDGESLIGTVKRNGGERPLKGTIRGNDIRFSYTVNYNGDDLTLTFTGKVVGDAMSGSVSFGGQLDDQWTAKRISPAKPKS